MIGYRTGKIILNANWTRNIKRWKIQSNVTICSNWDVFVCVFSWISRSWNCSFKIQKGGNFKIIFPVQYPIIYNPDSAWYYAIKLFMQNVHGLDKQAFWKKWKDKNKSVSVWIENWYAYTSKQILISFEH